MQLINSYKMHIYINTYIKPLFSTNLIPVTAIPIWIAARRTTGSLHLRLTAAHDYALVVQSPQGRRLVAGGGHLNDHEVHEHQQPSLTATSAGDAAIRSPVEHCGGTQSQ